LDPVILSIPIFFVLIGIELLIDRHAQKKQQTKSVYRWNDAFTNISCGIIDQVTAVFAKVFTVGMYALVYELFKDLTFWTIPPTAWAMILCFLAVDLAYYWSHRISHKVNLFWTGHVVHHQSEDYNLSVALRQGAFQKVLLFWIYLPLAALGFPTTWFLVSIGINLLYQFWIHTEMINKMGWFESIFNTPSHHRVHHGKNPKYIDKNHAGVLIIWDKWFGTFQEEEEKPSYGITNPAQTFNPIWAHVQPFVRLWKELKTIPGFTDKIRFLFKPPGWYPEGMGGFKAPPEVVLPVVKFDRPAHHKWERYLFVQYVFCLLIVSVFLFNLNELQSNEKAVLLIYSLFYVLSLGFIFDQSKAAKFTEYLRFAVGFGLAIAMFALDYRNLALLWMVVTGISMVWYSTLPNQNQHVTALK
jgi:alkylglycerol monooxygenase